MPSAFFWTEIGSFERDFSHFWHYLKCSTKHLFFWTPPRPIFREKLFWITQKAICLVWTLTKSDFYFKRRYSRLFSIELKIPKDDQKGYKTKNNGGHIKEAPNLESALFIVTTVTNYLKPLNISSSDFLRATSRLFSTILKISASIEAFFFFFFLSFSLYELFTLIFSPLFQHLW